MQQQQEGGICLLAWKRRTGLGAFSKNPWEQRWLVVAGTQLSYYVVGQENEEKPRGQIDLLYQKVELKVLAPSQKEDAPTLHQVEIHCTTSDSGTATDSSHPNTANVHSDSSAPEPKSHTIIWKFCFHTQQDLMQFMTFTHSLLDQTGQLPQPKDGDRFEHEFQPADHLYRWEMIVCPPVVYPIQIHGIVLEAGRNCVVVADFGLTGYGKQEGKNFNHADDRHQNAILTAWKKMRPQDNNDQRLNILTLTDPVDIRKWSKAQYKDHSVLDKLEKLGHLLQKLTPSASKGSHDEGSSHDKGHHEEEDESSNHTQENSPSGSGRGTRGQQPLPRSDPTEIVLARANFLLEYGEKYLPPYHVFHSNSECIAVWCKTGRWSTLQTAVFLSSTSVGGAKSATVATLGVAAAHAVLAPVVAVGGLVYVTVPMVMLRRSREKWQEATEKMNNLFWSWAPPAVFVAAIENWSEIGYSYQAKMEEEAQLRREEEERLKQEEEEAIKMKEEQKIAEMHKRNGTTAAPSWTTL